MDIILRGELGAITLFDLCQFLMLNRRTGELVIEANGRRSFVFFEDGRIVNAMDDGLNDGESAAMRVLLLGEGSFEFRAGAIGSARRIEMSTESLLLEIARRADELAERTAADREGGGAPRADASSAALFEMKQRQAAELEELFRNVATEAKGASSRGFEAASDGILGRRRSGTPSVRPASLADDLVREAGMLEEGVMFLCAPPRGGTTSVVAATLARMPAQGAARILLAEERPGYALAEAACAIDRCDLWSGLRRPGGLLRRAARTGPALVVVDAVRDRRGLEAVIELALGGFPVVAAMPGPGVAGSVRARVAGTGGSGRRVLLEVLAETARVFYGLVPLEDSGARLFAHEKVRCSLEVRGLLGSGDLGGFAEFCAERGRGDVHPLSVSYAELRAAGVEIPADVGSA